MTTPSSEDVISSAQLHEILSPDDIEELCEIFQQARENKFDPHELRELLGKYNIFFEDDQFEILFLKVNQSENACTLKKFNILSACYVCRSTQIAITNVIGTNWFHIYCWVSEVKIYRVKKKR